MPTGYRIEDQSTRVYTLLASDVVADYAERGVEWVIYSYRGYGYIQFIDE